jgi:uncharacterized protein (DUF427 family)
MRDYPESITPADHIEPAPRRVRAVLNGAFVFDTTAALYVWEWPKYPQYYIPFEDVNRDLLVDEGKPERLHRGSAKRYGLRVGDVERKGVAHLYAGDRVPELANTVRFDWAALDAWFEEDEQVFVHPRDPYTRESDGVVLAESLSPVMVFETGLPTRYYLDRTDVHFEHLEASDTVSSCPYKGRTTAYWSLAGGERDIAWSYEFPTGQLQPIAGLIAFYNEKVDTFLDGQLLESPHTHFSK